MTETPPKREHEWTWDDVDGQPVGAPAYCRECGHIRNFWIPEEDEPPCDEPPPVKGK